MSRHPSRRRRYRLHPILNPLEPRTLMASLASFTLIDADADAPIPSHDPIADGATIDLAMLPMRNLNVRANPDPADPPKSVRFTLDGAVVRTEGAAPFALAGDIDGDYNPWTPAPGTHTLTATPYAGPGATGAVGSPITITFTVVEGQGQDGGDEEEEPPPPPTDNLFDVRDYGARGDGTGDDGDAIRAAVAAAEDAGGGTIWMPGTYRVHFSPGEGPIVLRGRVTIAGAGSDASRIDVHPKTIDAHGFDVFSSTDPDADITFRDLHVAGPTDWTATYAVDAPPASFLQMSGDADGATASLRVERVAVDGPAFRSGFFTTGSNGRFEFHGSRIRVMSTAITCFQSSNRHFDRHLIIDGCDLEAGVAGGRPEGAGLGATVYAHPHVSVHASDTTFRNNPRVAIKQYGEGTSGNAPQYSTYERLTFRNNPAFTIITPGEAVTTTITDCVSDSGKIGARNDTVIEGCDFTDGGIGTSVRSMDAFAVAVRNSRFAAPTLDGEAIRATDGWTLDVADCTFDLGPAATLAEVGGTAAATFGGNVVDGSGGARGVNYNGGTGGRLELVGNAFRGDMTPVLVTHSESAAVVLTDNDFRTASGKGLHLNSVWAPIVTGGGNLFSDNGSTFQGHTKGGNPGPVAQGLTLPRSDNPATLAAAARLQLDVNHDTHRVAGTAAIKTINLGTYGTHQDRYVGSLVRLVVEAGAAWSLATGGNVVPARAGPRSPGEVVTLSYDPDARTWREE